MDRLAQEDIAAAAAAHRDLGREYDDAMAESLVERIGAEIDKRIDDRLGQPGGRPRRRFGLPSPADQLSQAAQFSQAAQPSQPSAPSRQGRPAWETVPMALGSMIIGGLVTNGMANDGHTPGSVIALIWIVIGVINVAYARRR
jgi:hypothetical protein